MPLAYGYIDFRAVMRVHDFAKARLSCPADGLLDRAALSRTKVVHLDAVKCREAKCSDRSP